MSFVLYTLLKDESPPLTHEGLMAALNDAFKKDKRYASSYETKAFTDKKSIRLKWDDTWPVVLTYGEGAQVRADSEEIKKRLGDAAPAGIETISRRIHVFFGDDRDREYTTQMLDLIQFLEGIDGALLFDPRQNKLVDPPTGSQPPT